MNSIALVLFVLSSVSALPTGDFAFRPHSTVPSSFDPVLGNEFAFTSANEDPLSHFRSSPSLLSSTIKNSPISFPRSNVPEMEPNLTGFKSLSSGSSPRLRPVPSQTLPSMNTDFNAMIKIIVSRRDCQNTPNDYAFLAKVMPNYDAVSFVEAVTRAKATMCTVSQGMYLTLKESSHLYDKYVKDAQALQITDEWIKKAGPSSSALNGRDTSAIQNFIQQSDKNTIHFLHSRSPSDPVRQLLIYDLYLVIKASFSHYRDRHSYDVGLSSSRVIQTKPTSDQAFWLTTM